MTDRKPDKSDDATLAEAPEVQPETKPAKEVGGRGGLDPTRYGDWEKGGRAVDF